VIGENSNWIVMKEDFLANEVGGNRYAEIIPKDAQLTVIRGWIPSHPTEDPPAQVRFQYEQSDYWTYEVNFLEACKLESTAAEKKRKKPKGE
jgi:hypothetical protein